MQLPFFSKKSSEKPREDLICKQCKATVPAKDAVKNRFICPSCGAYLTMTPQDRLHLVADKDSFTAFRDELKSVNFLHFPGYSEKLEKAVTATGEPDAVVCGTAAIDGTPCALFLMDTRFIMASMGSVVGERITRTFEYATAHRLPVVGFAASGGARMQEGIVSLMQMAKVSAAVQRHAAQRLLYISVLTNPTTGGVTASFAMQGDLILAEPGATVGFAGRRVVEQTTKTALPEGFQSAEFVRDHGFIDKIVPRDALRDTLATLLRLHAPRNGGIA